MRGSRWGEGTPIVNKPPVEGVASEAHTGVVVAVLFAKENLTGKAQPWGGQPWDPVRQPPACPGSVSPPIRTEVAHPAGRLDGDNGAHSDHRVSSHSL